MRNCILRGFYYVPEERIANPALVKRDMQVTPIWFNRKEPRPAPIPQCDFSLKGYIGFPVWYGMSKYPDEDYIDETTRGGELKPKKFPDPNHPRAAKGQAQFMADLDEHFEHYHVGLAVAPTGTGKTVSALNMAGKRGRSTLVVTDREYLGFEQWIPEAKDKLGLTDEDIGIVQGERCDYHKPFCVAIAKSLIDREYDPEFYKAFGTVIFDELHKFGAREMSRITGMFYAEVRLGMTATPKRGDGTQNLFLDYYGDCQIVATAVAMPCQLRVVDYYDTQGGRLPTTHGSRMQHLARDGKRNQVIVKEIMQLYNDGRNILVIGDNIQHLQRLEEMLWKLGVPQNMTGQFSRERYIFTLHPGEHKGEKVTIKRQKKAKVTNEYLNWVKSHAKVIFATYGMMKEGIDIPRLDAGIDVTPRREATQVVGRVRRPVPDKRIPIWVTVRDRSHKALMGYYQSRMKDYLDTNMEVLE